MKTKSNWFAKYGQCKTMGCAMPLSKDEAKNKLCTKCQEIKNKHQKAINAPIVQYK
jgi:hypothetical protein